MSLCIACISNNRVIMAADTQSSYGDMKLIINDEGTSKLYITGNMLMSSAGNVTAIQIAESIIKGYSNKRLDKKLIINQIIPAINRALRNEGIFKKNSSRVEFPKILLAQGKRLYSFNNQMCIRILKVNSIGSGSIYIDTYTDEMKNSKNPLKIMNEAILYAQSKTRSVDGGMVHYADTRGLRIEVINNDCSI